MKRSERDKVKTESNQRHAEPHHDPADNHERHISGGINVRGEIEAKRPPDLEQEHNAERKEDNASEKKKFIVECITLAIVAIYAGLTAWIAISSNKAANASKNAADTAKAALISSSRAWIEIRLPDPWDTYTIRQGEHDASNLDKLELLLSFTNIGHFPIRQFTSEQRMEIVNYSKSPSFEYSELHFVAQNSLLFPSRSLTIPAGMYTPPHLTVPVTQAMRDDLNNGVTYVAIYSQGEFSDDFGWHWFKYCSVLTFKVGAQYHIGDCVAYNDVGDGKLPHLNHI